MSQQEALYHGGCPDGFGAAWALWKSRSQENTVYHPTKNRRQAPDLPAQNSVCIMDMSFPRDQMTALHEKHGAENVLLIDHHKSAAQQLEGLPGCHIDLSRSAAVIAWQYFNPDLPVPELLLYVQDRDLFKWEMPDSRAVSAYIHSQKQDFQGWNRIANALRRHKSARDNIVSAGRAILVVNERHIRGALRAAFTTNIAGHRVPVVNSNEHRSEIAHRLLKQHPDTPFVAVYRDTGPNSRQWSLRSRPNGFDVSALAESLGGGGSNTTASFSQTTAIPTVPEP